MNETILDCNFYSYGYYFSLLQMNSCSGVTTLKSKRILKTVSVERYMARRRQAHNKLTVILYEAPESLVSGLILGFVPSSELRPRANAHIFQTLCGGKFMLSVWFG